MIKNTRHLKIIANDMKCGPLSTCFKFQIALLKGLPPQFTQNTGRRFER